MAAVTYFISKSGIWVSDGTALTTALEQQLASSIQSGEVTRFVINQAENTAPYIGCL